jgi:hypothetical protein
MNTRGILRTMFALGAAIPLLAAELRLKLESLAPSELSWESATGFDYRVEVARRLHDPDWQPLAPAQAGTGSRLRVTDSAVVAGSRFYRLIRSEPAGPQISPQAVEAETGAVYPAGTAIGSGFLGRQFTIPAKWKAGLREGSSSLLIVSDTEPGLFIQFTSLAGDAAEFARNLGQSFYSGEFSGFVVQGEPQVSGARVTLEWRGLGFTDEGESLEGVSLRCQAVVHPSGGAVAFVGLFTEPNRAVTERVLGELMASVVVVPRATRPDLVSLLSGKSFSWVKAANAGNGGNSGSLQRWTEKNAFFCPGTFEVTTRAESSFSGNVSGGGFYTGYSNSSSTDAGDWTVIETANGPVLVMISASGASAAFLQISGNSVIFGDQQFDFRAPHACP